MVETFEHRPLLPQQRCKSGHHFKSASGPTAEAAGGILLFVGVYTRVVAFILAGDIAAAYFMAHFPRSFFPAVNGGDAAVLFCFAFFYIFFAGGGLWSLDRAALKQE